MTGIIEGPFGLACRAGIEQRIGKTAVLEQEFRNGIGRFVKFKNIRMLLNLLVDGFVELNTAEQFF